MIALGSDHAGFTLKQQIGAHLKQQGLIVQDVGTHDTRSCDYPDSAAAVARAVAAAQVSLGILVCGTGTGMAIAANKIKGVKAAVCHSELQARMARAHNDCNVLCLGERLVGAGLALAIVDAFLKAEFEGGRHATRLAKIEILETQA